VILRRQTLFFFEGVPNWLQLRATSFEVMRRVLRRYEMSFGLIRYLLESTLIKVTIFIRAE